VNKKQILLEEIAGINVNTPIEEINDSFLKKHKISLYLMREDLNHVALSGNKWHKLKYNILEARNLRKIHC